MGGMSSSGWTSELWPKYNASGWSRRFNDVAEEISARVKRETQTVPPAAVKLEQVDHVEGAACGARCCPRRREANQRSRLVWWRETLTLVEHGSIPIQVC